MLCGELVVPCNTQSTTAWQNTKGGLSRGGSGTDKECRYQGLVQWLFVNHVRAKAAALSKASHVPRGCFEGATYPDTASAGVVNLGCTVFKKQTAVLRQPFFLFFNSYRLSFFLSVTSGNKVLDVRCRQSPRRWRDFPPCPLRRRIYPTLTFR